MQLDPFETALAFVGAVGAGLLIWLGRPALLSGGRGRLPRRFEVAGLDGARVPLDARQPLAYLSERLSQVGFIPADLPVRVPTVTGLGQHLLLVPFVHVEERALFVMGIESRMVGSSQLMLHILTPLRGGGRVETSTLAGLEQLARAPDVEVRVVLDAGSVEEIWSRHRLALTRHERADRLPIDASDWRRHASLAYEAWLQAGLRSKRLTLDATGNAYLIQTRPKGAT